MTKVFYFTSILLKISPNFFFFLCEFQTVSNRETEVQTEDEQQFLVRQQQVLMQGQTQTRGESPMRTPPSASKSMPRTSVIFSFNPSNQFKNCVYNIFRAHDSMYVFVVF